MIDDELLLAYLDGELPRTHAASIKAAIDSNPQIAARLEEHRQLRIMLQDRFQAMARAPSHPPVIAPVNFAVAPIFPVPRREIRRLPARSAQWMVIALVFSLGVIVGAVMMRPLPLTTAPPALSDSGG